MQTRIDRRLIAGLAGRGDGQRIVQELQRATTRLLLVTQPQRFRQFQQGCRARRLAHRQVPQVRTQGRHKMQGIETLGQHLVELQQRRGIILCQKGIHQRKTVFVIQDVQVLHHIRHLYVRPAERHRLIEDREGVAHRAIGLLRNDMQAFIIDRNVFPRSDGPQVPDDIGNADAVEIVGLAAGEDGREDLVLLGGGENEDGVCRRLFQRFQEGIERLCGEHVDLIDDVHAVLAHLRRDLHLVHQRLDIFHTVVRGRIQLVDAVGPTLLEGDARFARAAGFHLLVGMRAVDGFGENAGRGGLSHAARAAEQIGVRQFAPQDGILEGFGDGILADQFFERVRPVFAG